MRSKVKIQNRFLEEKSGIKLILTQKLRQLGLATPATAGFHGFNSSCCFSAGFCNKLRAGLHIIRLLLTGFFSGIFVIYG